MSDKFGTDTAAELEHTAPCIDQLEIRRGIVAVG